MKKINERLLSVSFLVTFLVGIVLTFRPTFGNVLTQGFLNVGVLSLIFIISYSVLFFSFYVTLRELKNKKNPFLINVILISSVFVVILSYLLKFVEFFYYPNYVFSKFHILLSFLGEFSTYQGVLLLIYLGVKKARNTKLGKLSLKSIINDPTFVLSVITFILCYQIIYKLPEYFYAEAKNQIIIANSRLKFNDTMTDLPGFAEKAVFIRDNTEPDSVIMQPEQSWDFPDLGNQVLLRYYLYPRVIVSPSKAQKFYEDYKDRNCKLYTIFAINPDNGAIFPDYSIESEEVKILDTNRNVKVFSDSSGESNIEVFKDAIVGVIKHKKCSI